MKQLPSKRRVRALRQRDTGGSFQWFWQWIFAVPKGGRRGAAPAGETIYLAPF